MRRKNLRPYRAPRAVQEMAGVMRKPARRAIPAGGQRHTRGKRAGRFF